MKSREVSLTHLRVSGLAACFLRKVTGELAFLPGPLARCALGVLGGSRFRDTLQSLPDIPPPPIGSSPCPSTLKGAPGPRFTLG